MMPGAGGVIRTSSGLCKDKDGGRGEIDWVKLQERFRRAKIEGAEAKKRPGGGVGVKRNRVQVEEQEDIPPHRQDKVKAQAPMKGIKEEYTSEGLTGSYFNMPANQKLPEGRFLLQFRGFDDEFTLRFVRMDVDSWDIMRFITAYLKEEWENLNLQLIQGIPQGKVVVAKCGDTFRRVAVVEKVNDFRIEVQDVDQLSEHVVTADDLYVMPHIVWKLPLLSIRGELNHVQLLQNTDMMVQIFVDLGFAINTVFEAEVVKSSLPPVVTAATRHPDWNSSTFVFNLFTYYGGEVNQMVVKALDNAVVPFPKTDKVIPVHHW